VLGDNKVTQTKFGGEDLPVKSAKLSADKKTVFLEVAGLQPVMQMRIRYNINAADGTALQQEIFNTINQVPAK
ncbi:MAG: hypothetical protein HY300_11485, partial [Verrucomicrobia bacterium]|nr:hypothetical protein [Verrucomicrobiota bacterium]